MSFIIEIHVICTQNILLLKGLNVQLLFSRNIYVFLNYFRYNIFYLCLILREWKNLQQFRYAFFRLKVYNIKVYELLVVATKFKFFMKFQKFIFNKPQLFIWQSKYQFIDLIRYLLGFFVKAIVLADTQPSQAVQ